MSDGPCAVGVWFRDGRVHVVAESGALVRLARRHAATDGGRVQGAGADVMLATLEAVACAYEKGASGADEDAIAERVLCEMRREGAQTREAVAQARDAAVQAAAKAASGETNRVLLELGSVAQTLMRMTVDHAAEMRRAVEGVTELLSGDGLRSTLMMDLTGQLSAQVVSPILARQQVLESTVQHLPDRLSDGVAQHVRDRCGEMARELMGSQRAMEGELSRAWQSIVQMTSKLAEGHAAAQELPSKIASAVRGDRDSLTEIERRLEALSASASGGAALVQHAVAKLDAVAAMQTRQLTDTRMRGASGEDQLCELLTALLPQREGWTVELVSGQSHGCDLAIKRVGYGEVRVESKAHGMYTGEKVRAKEVAKFERDLSELGTHGIMVSLHSGIVGKGRYDVQPLPSGKFAVYLSSNEYDVDTICSVVRHLHKIDDLTSPACAAEADQHPVARMTPEKMTLIQLHMRDMMLKVSDAKHHARTVISIMDSMTLGRITDIIMGGVSGNGSGNGEQQRSPFVCQDCGATYGTQKGLNVHVSRSHKQQANLGKMAIPSPAGGPSSRSPIQNGHAADNKGDASQGGACTVGENEKCGP